MEGFITSGPLWMIFILLVVGFVLLIKGADFFVEGSSSIAKRFNVPSIIIGLTIVAMGTSLPETAVSVSASIANNNALAVSNAVGSNIFNLMVVIGVCAVMTPVAVTKETIKRDIPTSAVCALLLLILGILSIGDVEKMTLGHLDGVILLIIFAIYIIMLIKAALSGAAKGEEDVKLITIPKSICFIIFGGAAIVIGGDLTVDSASRIASDFGMSQTLIGLTIVSIGTSLPELVTSIVAARKNEVQLALGNAVGSNIFNILMVLGIASTISPIAFLKENMIDIGVLLIFTLIVWLFAVTKKTIDKLEGGIMLLLYAVYSAYIIIR